MEHLAKTIKVAPGINVTCLPKIRDNQNFYTQPKGKGKKVMKKKRIKIQNLINISPFNKDVAPGKKDPKLINPAKHFLPIFLKFHPFQLQRKHTQD